MSASPAGEKSGPSRLRKDNGRRGWSTAEEEVLAQGMKKIVREGMKSENGFKTGYLNVLELYLKKHIPNCTLKADPHINSRITVWKRNYNTLTDILGNTGIGVDPATRLVDATDEQWDAWIKKDSNAKKMKNKKFPLYEAWCEIFGTTRATGEGAQDHAAAENPPSGLNGEHPSTPINNAPSHVPNEGSESYSGAGQTGDSSDVRKNVEGRKRKSSSIHDPFIDVMNSFCNTAAERLGEIAQRIGYEQDMSIARKKIIASVKTMDCLTRTEKLRVTHLISRNVENVDVFFSLDDQDRLDWTLMLLRGEV